MRRVIITTGVRQKRPTEVRHEAVGILSVFTRHGHGFVAGAAVRVYFSLPVEGEMIKARSRDPQVQLRSA